MKEYFNEKQYSCGYMADVDGAVCFLSDCKGFVFYKVSWRTIKINNAGDQYVLFDGKQKLIKHVENEKVGDIA